MDRQIGLTDRLGGPALQSTRTYHEFAYAARRGPQTARVVFKAEAMAAGDIPRYLVSSLDLPSPEALYRDLYCARGRDENFIKMMKNDRVYDRTSDHRFVAHEMRLFFSAAAYVRHHSLRSEVLVHTERTPAQPMTVIVKLFMAYKDRVKLHLPSACPVKALLLTATEILYPCHGPPVVDTGRRYRLKTPAHADPAARKVALCPCAGPHVHCRGASSGVTGHPDCSSARGGKEHRLCEQHRPQELRELTRRSGL